MIISRRALGVGAAGLAAGTLLFAPRKLKALTPLRVTGLDLFPVRATEMGSAR